MVQEELPQAWWFDSHNLARPSPWLNSTLSGFASLSLLILDALLFLLRAF
jgi:hypothetical protein